ncbi:acyl CoA:acetate/3-ketoacid CoA transferase [Pseudomonas mucidolens]|uniref:acyl CoA:acetate/3-ketoacid CoA transferase n=1 Tax=Pseudomonas mucidolens TaxID=46679 RepID=UPI0030DC11C7
MDGLNNTFIAHAPQAQSVAVASFDSDYVMEPKHVITASQAAALVPSNSTITTGGFGSCGHPDLLTEALAARFIATAQPTDLTLVFAAGQGDRANRGLNRLALKGLLKKVVGGYWALAPSIGQMALRGEIEAHNWPQGVISHLFRSIAGGKSGVLSEIGLHTFIDPRQEGGKVGPATTEELISVVNIGGREELFYPAMPINVAFLRGSRADVDGNISMEDEANFQDSLAQAQAVHNSGGIVIVQVLELVDRNSLDPQTIRIPGIFVDYLVLATPETHWQTYGEARNNTYTGRSRSDTAVTPLQLCAKKIVARRALYEMARYNAPIVNLGIGTPEFIARVASEERCAAHVLTVESGVIGGTPARGLSFGASSNPQAILDQASQFDFYDGGGIDLAFLGFGQADRSGNVNISRLGGKLNGVGGFINISQSAKRVVFCGTFTAAGLELGFESGQLTIKREGDIVKFIEAVEHMSFNAAHAESRNCPILFITERAVLSLKNGRLTLKEVAPGVDIERDILARSTADIIVPDHVDLMPASIFLHQPLSITDKFWRSRD